MSKIKIPQHIGIIMDGNRRWAKKHGISSVLGHQEGYNTLKKVANWCFDEGIKILTVWAFSTENWNRSKFEVSYLMKLIKFGLKNDIGEFQDKSIQLNIFGNFERLPKKIISALNNAMEVTKNNKRGILNVGLSYGGRQEIIDVIKNVIKRKTKLGDVNEKLVNKLLYTQGMPDPDMMIRTSGEQRLSGFLPWQSTYSEIMFIKKLWPDFDKNDVKSIIQEYNLRSRRFGV